MVKARGLLRRPPQGSERVTSSVAALVMKWISKHSIHQLGELPDLGKGIPAPGNTGQGKEVTQESCRLPWAFMGALPWPCLVRAAGCNTSAAEGEYIRCPGPPSVSTRERVCFFFFSFFFLICLIISGSTDLKVYFILGCTVAHEQNKTPPGERCF